MGKVDEIVEVEDHEVVARILFSPYFFTGDGRLSIAAFNLRMLKSGPEKYVSIERLALVAESDFINFAHSLMPPTGNRLYGYALLKVADARQLLPYVDVKKHPSHGHLSHAGIEYSLEQGTRQYGVVTNPFLLSIISDLCDMCDCKSID